MVFMSAFQAEDRGSIPLTRSRKIKQLRKGLFYFMINIFQIHIRLSFF